MTHDAKVVLRMGYTYDYTLNKNSYKNELLKKKNITINIFILNDSIEDEGTVDEAM